MSGTAVLSEDGVYRYWLTRAIPSPLRWVRPVTFVMLNPSTADATLDDPTIRRCLAFATKWGATELRVVNLFALRSTDPKELYKHPDPIGPENRRFLEQGGRGAHRVIAAWGAHAMRVRPEWVREALSILGPSLSCLRLTADGSPGHPLYLPAASEPQPFPGPGRFQP